MEIHAYILILSLKSSPLLSQPEHLELDGIAKPDPGAEGEDEVEHVRKHQGDVHKPRANS